MEAPGKVRAAGGLQAEYEPQGGSRQSTSCRGALGRVRAVGFRQEYELQGGSTQRCGSRGAFSEALAVGGSKLPKSHSLRPMSSLDPPPTSLILVQSSSFVRSLVGVVYVFVPLATPEK